MNITELQSNFLLDIIYPKTSLWNQQTHQELLWILIYTFKIKQA
jgi:hypothetical protein